MNPSGLWRGKSQGRVGHFKFINVELLPDRNTLRQQRRSASEKLKVTEPGPPQSVEDLLKRIGLEVRTSALLVIFYTEILKIVKKIQAVSTSINFVKYGK